MDFAKQSTDSVSLAQEIRAGQSATDAARARAATRKWQAVAGPATRTSEKGISGGVAIFAAKGIGVAPLRQHAHAALPRLPKRRFAAARLAIGPPGGS